ncbi:MAG: hypothetical protein P8R37_06425 [Opitutae bacterium]|jgi:hypothetical protein|nr:hypothetical protein [Opitutae bacterium]MDG1301208.1 hypothetical protein [Opitutae bacterium]
MSKQRDIQPYWRPDFKIQSTLPDIKVVRTDFIINAIAVALMLIAGFTLLQGEYRAYSLHRSIASMQQSIGETKTNNNQNLKESERFRESAQSVVELQRFFRAPLVAHELMAELARLKPAGLIFSRVMFSSATIKQKGKDQAKSQMTYEINITGDTRGLMALTQFKAMLQASPSLSPAGFEVVVDESMQQRNAMTGITPFQVLISLTPAPSGIPSKGGEG